MQITLLTFGFKYGIPLEADLVFDVDPEPQVDDAFADVAGHQVACRDQHRFANGLDGRELKSFGVQDLLGPVAQMQEIAGHGFAPCSAGGSAGSLSRGSL